MKKRFSLLVMFIFAIAGFLTLTTASSSFAAAQAAKSGVSFSLSGQYIGKAFWSENQSEMFSPTDQVTTGNYDLARGIFTSTGHYSIPSHNTFDVFLQRLRMNASMSYDKLASGMPLAAIFTQFDLTNAYNGVTNGLGSNGWQALGETPVPNGFNHDFNTFGLRQAYIRVITPVGAVMFGRMPVKFGLGIAVNTNADGLGDFLPLGNVGLFLGSLFGNETTAYSNGSTPNAVGTVPPATYGYSHIQSGTVPTIEAMSLKPMNDVSWSIWLTEAHLDQFNEALSSIVSGVYESTPTFSSSSASANITFGGLSATYAANGTKIAGEYDYFRGDIMNSPYSAYYPFGLLVADSSASNARTKINSYDLYLTGSQLLSTSMPVTIGLKFGAGGPISANHLDMTYYSMLQNTRTIFGDVIGNDWQPIEFSAPGLNYLYSGPNEAMGANLSNRYVIMADATEHLASGNALQESLIHSAWLKTDINGSQVFGGNDIGTEFDLNFTHHFTKTLSWQVWGAYVWTGSGVDSSPAIAPTSAMLKTGSNTAVPTTMPTTANGWGNHKNISALGSAFIWNF